MVLIFVCKSIIANQFKHSRVKHMCIFHVFTVRGLSGSKEASAPSIGLPNSTEAPLATRLHVHTHISYNVHNLLPIFVQIES